MNFTSLVVLWQSFACLFIFHDKNTSEITDGDSDSTYNGKSNSVFADGSGESSGMCSNNFDSDYGCDSFCRSGGSSVSSSNGVSRLGSDGLYDCDSLGDSSRCSRRGSELNTGAGASSGADTVCTEDESFRITRNKKKISYQTKRKFTYYVSKYIDIGT